MDALYRNTVALPIAIGLSLLLGACDSGPPPPPKKAAEAPSNFYLETLQEAEAAKRSAQDRLLEQQRVEELIRRDQAPR